MRGVNKQATHMHTLYSTYTPMRRAKVFGRREAEGNIW